MYSYSYKYINFSTMPPAADSKTNIIIIWQTEPSRAPVWARVVLHVQAIYNCNAILFMAPAGVTPEGVCCLMQSAQL